MISLGWIVIVIAVAWAMAVIGVGLSAEKQIRIDSTLASYSSLVKRYQKEYEEFKAMMDQIQ